MRKVKEHSKGSENKGLVVEVHRGRISKVGKNGTIFSCSHSVHLPKEA